MRLRSRPRPSERSSDRAPRPRRRLVRRALGGTWRGLRGAGRGLRGTGRALRGTGRAVLLLRQVPGAWVIWFVAVVLSFIAFGTSDTVYDAGVLGWGVMPFVGALVGLPFGLVAARPMTAWTVSAGSAQLLAVLLPRHPDTPWTFLVVHGLVVFALLFGVAVRGRWRETLIAWLGSGALFVAGSRPDQQVGWVVAVTSVALVGTLAGRLVVTNTALARQTRVTADEKARRLVLEERTRIARDLHDIVAHHMSLIVVQAETAQYRRPDLTPGAREELDAISSAAREALSETRTLLSVLRREDERATYAPQPGLGEIEELCRTALRAGVPMEWHLLVAPESVRRATSLAAYRIVQEGLANAARHAPGAAVTVSVVRDGGDVRVSVENGASPTAGPARGDGGPGHGIIGMREHAVAEGGTLTVGPTAAGGYRVEAVLPAPDPAAGAVA